MFVTLFRCVFSPEFWLLTLLLCAVCVMGLPAQDQPPAVCLETSADPPSVAASDLVSTRETLVPAQNVVAPRDVPDLAATDASPLTAQPLPGVDEHSLRDIMTLRGEQENLFAGTVFEEMALPADDGAFLNALRKVAYEAQQEAPQSSTVAPAATASWPAQLDDLELVEQLRQTSRLLDTRAADWEATADYQRADPLRSLARRLRRQARQLAQ